MLARQFRDSRRPESRVKPNWEDLAARYRAEYPRSREVCFLIKGAEKLPDLLLYLVKESSHLVQRRAAQFRASTYRFSSRTISERGNQVTQFVIANSHAKHTRAPHSDHVCLVQFFGVLCFVPFTCPPVLHLIVMVCGSSCAHQVHHSFLQCEKSLSLEIPALFRKLIASSFPPTLAIALQFVPTPKRLK